MNERLEQRRVARAAISVELLIEMITEGYRLNGIVECVEGVPPGSVFIGSTFDGETATAYLLFAHETFTAIRADEQIPIIPVTFRRYYPGPDEECESALQP